MVIDAYRMLLMARLDEAMAQMEYMASQAELEQAVGLDLDEIIQRVH
jgi:outer membrane protein TolC